jgi:hypothetical protein
VNLVSRVTRSSLDLVTRDGLGADLTRPQLITSSRRRRSRPASLALGPYSGETGEPFSFLCKRSELISTFNEEREGGLVANRVLAHMATTGIYLLHGIPREVQQAARIRAVRERTTLRAVLLQALNEYAAGARPRRENEPR